MSEFEKREAGRKLDAIADLGKMYCELMEKADRWMGEERERRRRRHKLEKTVQELMANGYGREEIVAEVEKQLEVWGRGEVK